MLSKYKIGWVTPATDRTSVTGFSTSVVFNLNELVDIDFFTFDDHYCNQFDLLKNKKFFLNDTSEIELDKYDYIIYNFGNNWENHGKIINMSSKRPGIIILHDASMHHVVAYYTNEKLKDRSLYSNFIISEYGKCGADVVSDSEIYSSSPRYGPWDSSVGPNFGFLDFFTEGCSGIVAHSKYTLSKFLKINSPVHCSRLPGDEKGLWDLSEIFQWQERFLTRPEVTFGVIGFVNEQKNISKVIDYILLIKNSGITCKLLILGGDKSGYHQKIKEYARSKGLESLLEFNLNLDRLHFDKAKKAVDVYISFRYPNYEGCSAAAFESMQTGRPLITLSNGAFGELDKNSVYFIENIEELESHAKKISRLLLSDRKSMIDVGKLGRSYSLNYDAKNYAIDFHNFLSKVKKSSRSKNSISSYSMHQSDLYLHSPKYIYFSEDPAINAELSKCLEPYVSIVDNPHIIRMLVNLYRKNPLLYWDVLGLFKKIKAGIGSPILIDPSELDNELLDCIFSVVRELDSESLLKKLCSIIKINYDDYIGNNLK